VKTNRGEGRKKLASHQEDPHNDEEPPQFFFHIKKRKMVPIPDGEKS
jgi:hypothetical protein